MRGLPGGATVRIPFQESRVQLVVVIGRGVQMLPQFLFFTVGLCLGAKGAWRTMSLDSLAFSAIGIRDFGTCMRTRSLLPLVVVVVPFLSPLLIVVCVTSDMDIEAVCRSSRKYIWLALVCSSSQEQSRSKTYSIALVCMRVCVSKLMVWCAVASASRACS